jgi:hypothetical protein
MATILAALQRHGPVVHPPASHNSTDVALHFACIAE